jgi:hypothetical protein
MIDPVITHRPFRFHRRTYEWRQTGQSWELTTAGQTVAQVAPDEKYPGMWRADLGDDPLSDMVNLTRAKDAALSLADRAIETGRLSRPGGPPISFPDPAVPQQPPDVPASPRASRKGNAAALQTGRSRSAAPVQAGGISADDGARYRVAPEPDGGSTLPPHPETDEEGT